MPLDRGRGVRPLDRLHDVGGYSSAARGDYVQSTRYSTKFVKNGTGLPIFPLMTDGKPRRPTHPLYVLLREGRNEEFNRRKLAGETCELTGCDLRGIDLRDLDLHDADLSDCYFRQADLRGLDLRSCRLEGASLHAARVSGVYFPPQLSPEEIEMSVRLGTRLRYRG